MSGKVKVTAIEGAYALDGVSYGPFQASKDKPFLEVPEALANALNLTRYEDGKDSGKNETEQELGRWNVSTLVEQVKSLTKERDSLKTRVAELEGEKAEWEKQRDSLLVDLSNSMKRESEEADQVDASNEPTKQEGAPLVPGLPLTDLLTQHGFTTMEKLEAGLVVAEGQTESPVQQVEGIGKKSLEAYAKAVADWKASQV